MNRVKTQNTRRRNENVEPAFLSIRDGKVERFNVTNVSNKMDLKNPCYIPRNHIVEDALINAVNGDMKEINLIAELLKDPFTEKNGFEKYTLAPSSNEPYITYCGT